MKVFVFTILAGCLVGGCSNNPEKEKGKAQTKEEKIQTVLAKLDPADRKLAEGQKFCPVQTDQRLGAMGAPIKIVLDGKPVFLCCDHCEEKAKKDKEGTLKKVEELKAANK
jgi:hypothetical protein